MHRSLLQLTTFSNSRRALPLYRTLHTTSAVGGYIGIKLREESRLLDTSRNVEVDDTKEINEVALSKDGRVIVCWHPETPFPYEFSKPIPTDVTPTQSVLKVQALEPVREVFRKKNKRIVVQELMQLTYTAKYPWLTYRRPRTERYKKENPSNTKRDREYL